MHRVIAVGLGLAAALLACAAPLHAEAAGAALRDDDIVARVNGTPIYRKSVRDVVQGILAVQDTKPDPAAVGQLADEALDSLISLELLYQESQARNITVSDQAVDEEIARSQSQFPSLQDFDAAMQAKGMSVADLRRDTRKTMSVNRLLESTVWKDLRITPAQIREFYEQNKEDFKHPPEIRASHILIRVPQGAAAAERNAAKQRATQLIEKLKAGADFAQSARESSQDPGSAALGGDLGYLAKGDMDETFEQHAFALALGQLSGVVSTPYGFDIIKVTDRRGAGYAPLPEVEDRVRELLLKRTRQQRETDFVAALRKKAKVELTQP